MILARRLFDLAFVLLLAVALTASGGMSMSMALNDAAMTGRTVASSGLPTTCAMPMEHASHAAPGGASSTCDAAHGPDDRPHMPAHCSICLFAGAFLDIPGLDLPALAVVWHSLPWIGPALAALLDIHARAPPARGPPSSSSEI